MRKDRPDLCFMLPFFFNKLGSLGFGLQPENSSIELIFKIKLTPKQ